MKETWQKDPGIIKYIEKWDELLFNIYNFLSLVRFYIWDRFVYYKELTRNKELKEKFKGERCFVVLNGPSIKNYDLDKIKDEVVFCSNAFQLSSYYDIVRPNYHCIIDSDYLGGTLLQRLKETMQEKDGVSFILNKKIYGNLTEEEKKRAYAVYPNNFGTRKKIRCELDGVTSSTNNVGLFCVQAAMFMGFKEIIILGLDLAPGPLPTVYGNIEEEQYGIEVYKKNSRLELCGFHWYYYLTQLNSFYVQDEARRRGVEIYNVNKESSIRAFGFKEYEDFFDK